jgi:hypothetical protein
MSWFSTSALHFFTTYTLPFAYLGLPLGTTRSSVQDLSPIADQIERRLNASARFLVYGGRLQLVVNDSRIITLEHNRFRYILDLTFAIINMLFPKKN